MKLILFTNSYPYGIGEMWKHNEIKLLASSFSEITIIPLHLADNYNPKELKIDNVRYTEPLFHFLDFSLNYIDLFKTFFGNSALSNFQELLNILFRFTKNNCIKLLNSAKRSRNILNNDIIKRILFQDNSDTILYFYWGLGSAEIIPLIDTKKFKKVVVRMHRYDLYENENENYIPFRKQLLNKNITILPSSYDGLMHLKFIYPKHKAKIKVQRCGVIKQNKFSVGSKNEILKIVSCSLLVPVKRINLMIEAATLLNIPFEWHHIGYGPLETELKDLVILNSLNDKFKFIGKIDSELVLNYYIDNNIDLFVNTSRSEGVPFSIMESFSVSIPVVATDAGGTKEIVDSSVGYLLKNDFSAIDLKNIIENFYYLSKDDKVKIKKNALLRFENKCNMEKLTKEFIEVLTK